jgi:hypothetical protein
MFSSIDSKSSIFDAITGDARDEEQEDCVASAAAK